MFTTLAILLGCNTTPSPIDSSSPAPEALDTGTPIETIPGEESAVPVDLTDASPFDPNVSYTWRLDISDDQVDLINASGASSYYDVDTHIYGYADALTISTLDNVSSIVFEKPEVKVGGEMNFCELPCKAQLLLDLNQYTDDQTMGGYDNIKLGNMLYSGPYAEFFMYNVYFPSQGVNSPMAAYAWLEASYVGYLSLDYLVMEMTKEDFLDTTYGPGNWLMAYEGYGDIGSGSSNYPSCQAGVCDDAVLDEIDTDLNASVEAGTVIDFLDRRYLGGHERFFAYCGAEKMVGQWDGYCDAAHNYTMVIVANSENPDQPFIDLVEHSLDLALNPDWDYSWYGIFGGGYLVQACEGSADGCADAYVDYLEGKNEEWAANVETFNTQLDAQNAYLVSIGMQYDDYAGWLTSNKTFIEERHDTIATQIENYRDPCSVPDTGWYWGMDTGNSGCSDTAADTGTITDTAMVPADTAAHPADSADTGA